MARLFFAVGISGDAARALGSLSSRLEESAIRDCLRFVAIEQAHYTLRFLGEQSPERQASAVRAGYLTASGARSFELVPHTLGVFPDERRPHTLWIGVGRGSVEMKALAERLGAALAAEGFSPEARPFVPHLTLARVKRRPPAAAMRALLAKPHEAIAPLRVEAFTLMESRSSPSGVRYVPLETFPLEIPCKPSESPSTAGPKS